MLEKTDHNYDYILDKIYGYIKELSKPKYLKIKTPIISRNNKKTYFSNFSKICKTLDIDREQVKSFLFAELNCDGSIDRIGGINIDGKYYQNQIENILKKYIKEYIVCDRCKSSNIRFVKDTRIIYLVCIHCIS